MKAALVCICVLILAGCSATVAAGDATKAQSADTLRAEADLAATQAFSATLATQAGQVTRLVESTLEAMRMWQAVTVLLAGALVVAVVVAVVVGGIAALRASRPRVIDPSTYIIQAPAQAGLLDDPDQWPEARAIQRARRRALLEQGRERREGE